MSIGFRMTVFSRLRKAEPRPIPARLLPLQDQTDAETVALACARALFLNSESKTFGYPRHAPLSTAARSRNTNSTARTSFPV